METRLKKSITVSGITSFDDIYSRCLELFNQGLIMDFSSESLKLLNYVDEFKLFNKLDKLADITKHLYNSEKHMLIWERIISYTGTDKKKSSQLFKKYYSIDHRKKQILISLDCENPSLKDRVEGILLFQDDKSILNKIKKVSLCVQEVLPTPTLNTTEQSDKSQSSYEFITQNFSELHRNSSSDEYKKVIIESSSFSSYSLDFAYNLQLMEEYKLLEAYLAQFDISCDNIYLRLSNLLELHSLSLFDFIYERYTAIHANELPFQKLMNRREQLKVEYDE